MSTRKQLFNLVVLIVLWVAAVITTLLVQPVSGQEGGPICSLADYEAGFRLNGGTGCGCAKIYTCTECVNGTVTCRSACRYCEATSQAFCGIEESTSSYYAYPTPSKLPGGSNIIAARYVHIYTWMYITGNRTDNVSYTVEFDEGRGNATCSVKVGDQFCASCEYASAYCPNISKSEPRIDCTNIEAGATATPCAKSHPQVSIEGEMVSLDPSAENGVLGPLGYLLYGCLEGKMYAHPDDAFVFATIPPGVGSAPAAPSLPTNAPTIMPSGTNILTAEPSPGLLLGSTPYPTTSDALGSGVFPSTGSPSPVVNVDESDSVTSDACSSATITAGGLVDDYSCDCFEQGNCTECVPGASDWMDSNGTSPRISQVVQCSSSCRYCNLPETFCGQYTYLHEYEPYDGSILEWLPIRSAYVWTYTKGRTGSISYAESITVNATHADRRCKVTVDDQVCASCEMIECPPVKQAFYPKLDCTNIEAGATVTLCQSSTDPSSCGQAKIGFLQLDESARQGILAPLALSHQCQSGTMVAIDGAIFDEEENAALLPSVTFDEYNTAPLGQAVPLASPPDGSVPVATSPAVAPPTPPATAPTVSSPTLVSSSTTTTTAGTTAVRVSLVRLGITVAALVA